jgi:hypothetical protein
MSSRALVYFVSVALFVQSLQQTTKVVREVRDSADADLRTQIEESPILPFRGVHFAAHPPELGGSPGPSPGLRLTARGPFTKSSVAKRPTRLSS